jgi:hypothetical protein
MSSIWTLQLQTQYENMRNDIVSKFNNNMSVINARWVAAALDYPFAKDEINNSKSVINVLTNELAIESEKLNMYLDRLNEENGPKLLQTLSERELEIRRLETENRKVENTKMLREEQAKSLYNKYDGNYHDQPFTYAPWEVSSSSWYSWSPLAATMNISPSARSGILFLSFFFGFFAIIVLGAKAIMLFYNTKPGSAIAAPAAPVGAVGAVGAVAAVAARRRF